MKQALLPRALALGTAVAALLSAKDDAGRWLCSVAILFLLLSDPTVRPPSCDDPSRHLPGCQKDSGTPLDLATDPHGCIRGYPWGAPSSG